MLLCSKDLVLKATCWPQTLRSILLGVGETKVPFLVCYLRFPRLWGRQRGRLFLSRNPDNEDFVMLGSISAPPIRCENVQYEGDGPFLIFFVPSTVG